MFRRELSTISASSSTGHHDLLREDEVADFLAVVPRLDDAELDDFFAARRARLRDDSLDEDFFVAGRRLGDDSLDEDFFAAGRRRGDDSLDENFFAAGRGLLDGVARAADFFAGLLAAGADADSPSEP